MGKKKKEKKGRGAEKTAQKVEKKLEKRTKKMLQEKGEDEIEKLIADIEEQERKRNAVVEEKCSAPSPRCNLTLTPHPDKDELIMFGGEFFNGSKTFMYNDLLFYNVKTREWSQVKAPNGPPPRCAHQAVALRQGGGQLWIFGGEFASPSQSQFYHYRELWVYHIGTKSWEKINAPGGPSARSGHRMAVCKKLILVIGGFHDNVRDYKYFSDVHAFNLETYTWSCLDVAGIAPAPRSGFMVAGRSDQGQVVICGGYSKEKVKRDVDKGKTHTDMFVLTVDASCKHEATPMRWKWVSRKQSGIRPSPRCGCSMAVVSADKAVAFGGVYDEEEDEEQVTGVFYNDMYTLELENGKWHEVTLRSKTIGKEKKKRRKRKNEAEAMDGGEEVGDNGELEGDLDSLAVDDDDDESEEEETPGMDADPDTQAAGGQSGDAIQDVFTVKIGAQSSASTATAGPHSGQPAAEKAFVPSARMNPALAVKSGVLYMFGGNFEVGDKQHTLCDFYSLDLHKLEQWDTIVENNLADLVWEDSESSEEDEEEEEEEEEEAARGGAAEGGLQEDMETDDSEESEDSDEEEAMDEGMPAVKPGELLEDYYSRCDTFWLRHAEAMASAEGIKVTAKQVKKAAYRMAKEKYEEES